MSEYEKTSLESVRRQCETWLVRRGIDPRENILTFDYASDKDRFEAWFVDSACECAKALLTERPHMHGKRDLKLALRCYGQVREYVGRMRGFAPTGLHDAVGILQNALERRLAGE